MLLERPGDLVSREELKARLWPADTFGDFDHGINKAINKLRDALNDSAPNPRYIETVARRGYRFVAEVTVRADNVGIEEGGDMSIVPKGRFRAGALLFALVFSGATPSGAAGPATWVRLTPSALSPRYGATTVVYRGVRALHLETADADRSFVPEVKTSPFRTGTIDVDVAARPNSTADPTARGFAGVVFGVRKDGGFEGFYIRTKNGRAPDQEHRNHATQYISEPEWGWKRLRTTYPSRYEAYVDLVPGAWTHLHVDVGSRVARLYVNHAAQPTLIATRILGGAPSSRGEIGLFFGPRTEANFAHLVVVRDKRS